MADVFFFSSQRDIATTGPMRDRYAQACRERGWNFQSRILKPAKTPAGRPILPISVSDAAGLYPRSHRARVATLVLGTDPVVPLRPNADEAIRYKHTIPLFQYLDYKSCWIRVPHDAENLTWTGVFEGWCARIECEDEHDPRCLPFHVFTGKGAGLSSETSRRAFNQTYGPGAHRTDDASLEWRLEPRNFHGNESLTIAGYECRPGFHWDVVGRHRWRLGTPSGIWEGTGHVNVYPDAHIRTKGNNVRKLS